MACQFLYFHNSFLLFLAVLPSGYRSLLVTMFCNVHCFFFFLCLIQVLVMHFQAAMQF